MKENHTEKPKNSESSMAELWEQIAIISQVWSAGVISHLFKHIDETGQTLTPEMLLETERFVDNTLVEMQGRKLSPEFVNTAHLAASKTKEYLAIRSY